ncbi:ATP-binding protein [Sphaerisporangium sp. NPDC049002]|uniref:ATP-binding protein n=1 Tax=Sphaerisporangium sp. NPDC049002 TaxID=3155392 RepID=UPI0033D2BE98
MFCNRRGTFPRLTSELLGNAISYGAPPIRLSMWATAGDLYIRVTDHGPGEPRCLDLGLDAVHGRGLVIVASLACDWGVKPTSDGLGKTVWARWNAVSGNARSSGVKEAPVVPCQRNDQGPAASIGLSLDDLPQANVATETD